MTDFYPNIPLKMSRKDIFADLETIALLRAGGVNAYLVNGRCTDLSNRSGFAFAFVKAWINKRSIEIMDAGGAKRSMRALGTRR